MLRFGFLLSSLWLARHSSGALRNSSMHCLECLQDVIIGKNHCRLPVRVLQNSRVPWLRECASSQSLPSAFSQMSFLPELHQDRSLSGLFWRTCWAFSILFGHSECELPAFWSVMPSLPHQPDSPSPSKDAVPTGTKGAPGCETCSLKTETVPGK